MVKSNNKWNFKTRENKNRWKL